MYKYFFSVEFKPGETNIVSCHKRNGNEVKIPAKRDAFIAIPMNSVRSVYTGF